MANFRTQHNLGHLRNAQKCKEGKGRREGGRKKGGGGEEKGSVMHSPSSNAADSYPDSNGAPVLSAQPTCTILSIFRTDVQNGSYQDHVLSLEVKSNAPREGSCPRSDSLMRAELSSPSTERWSCAILCPPRPSKIGIWIGHLLSSRLNLDC